MSFPPVFSTSVVLNLDCVVPSCIIIAEFQAGCNMF